MYEWIQLSRLVDNCYLVEGGLKFQSSLCEFSCHAFTS